MGILVPSFNTVVQPELESLRPGGVTNHVGRFAFDANVVQNVKDEAAKIATAKPSALIVALSTEGIPGGLALLEGGAAEISAETSLPVYTASHAILAAMTEFGVRTVGLVTPFGAAENENVKSVFAQSGVEVVADHALARPIDQIGETPLAEVRSAFRAADTKDAEALVHVGGGLPVVGLIDELEREHGKPILACNVAMYWQALRGVGVQDPVDGFGALLAGRSRVT